MLYDERLGHANVALTSLPNLLWLTLFIGLTYVPHQQYQHLDATTSTGSHDAKTGCLQSDRRQDHTLDALCSHQVHLLLNTSMCLLEHTWAHILGSLLTELICYLLVR